jgi:hypothetical protein
MQKQGKRLIGAAVLICGTALILGIVLGTRHSNKSNNLKDSAILGSDAVLAKCGALQMYNPGASNALDGTSLIVQVLCLAAQQSMPVLGLQ